MAPSQINPFEMPDYLNEARERVTFAFEEAVVFDKYLQLLSTPAEELLEACKQMMQDRSIDTAMGAQLDIIGRIVGQDRILIGADLIPYFGYLGALLPESYGDLNNSGVGGFYWDINTPLGGNITLSDEQYRLFIKAKILKNLTRATPEDVINFIQFVFEVEKVYISMDDSAHAIIYVSSDISIFERALLLYFTEGRYRSYFVPKTLGVKYDYGVFEAENFFGFFGVPGALGYGTLVINTPFESESINLDYANNGYKLYEFAGVVTKFPPTNTIIDSETMDLYYQLSTYLLWEDTWEVVGGGVYSSLIT